MASRHLTHHISTTCLILALIQDHCYHKLKDLCCEELQQKSVFSSFHFNTQYINHNYNQHIHPLYYFTRSFTWTDDLFQRNERDNEKIDNRCDRDKLNSNYELLMNHIQSIDLLHPHLTSRDTKFKQVDPETLLAIIPVYSHLNPDECIVVSLVYDDIHNNGENKGKLNELQGLSRVSTRHGKENSDCSDNFWILYDIQLITWKSFFEQYEFQSIEEAQEALFIQKKKKKNGISSYSSSLHRLKVESIQEQLLIQMNELKSQKKPQLLQRQKDIVLNEEDKYWKMYDIQEDSESDDEKEKEENTLENEMDIDDESEDDMDYWNSY